MEEIIICAIIAGNLAIALIGMYYAVKFDLTFRSRDRKAEGISEEALDVMDDTYRIEFDQR